jgi:hypothetical protein
MMGECCMELDAQGRCLIRRERLEFTCGGFHGCPNPSMSNLHSVTALPQGGR